MTAPNIEVSEEDFTFQMVARFGSKGVQKSASTTLTGPTAVNVTRESDFTRTKDLV